MTDPASDHPRIISASTLVEAPADVVFAILADPHQHPRIDGSGSLRKTLRGPHRLTRGDTFGVDMKLYGFPYKIRNTVVEYEEDRRIAWRHFAGHRWRYVLEPVEGGTKVTESFDYSHYGLLSRLAIVAARFPQRNRAGIAATLTKLKEVAEADARRNEDIA